MSEVQGCLYRWRLLWCAERIHELSSSCVFVARCGSRAVAICITRELRWGPRAVLDAEAFNRGVPRCRCACLTHALAPELTMTDGSLSRVDRSRM
jgi:hypothetical protein